MSQAWEVGAGSVAGLPLGAVPGAVELKNVNAGRALPTDEEVELAAITPQWSDLTDDTDWEALYADADQ